MSNSSYLKQGCLLVVTKDSSNRNISYKTGYTCDAIMTRGASIA